jgi:hypothetical protein
MRCGRIACDGTTNDGRCDRRPGARSARALKICWVFTDRKTSRALAPILTKMHGDAVNFIPVVNLFGSSASGQKKELVVLFDSNNVVKRYSMSESAVSRKTGIFN